MYKTSPINKNKVLSGLQNFTFDEIENYRTHVFGKHSVMDDTKNLVLIVLLFVPLSAYASEIKSDGKTTQGIEEENKTVRVGYFSYANFQEGGYGEHKQGAGYEYLQKISYITGWKYEYVYGSFKECMDMLADGSYQKSVGPSGWKENTYYCNDGKCICRGCAGCFECRNG